MPEEPHGPRSLASLRSAFDTWLRQKTQVVLVPIVRIVNRTGLTPNVLTLFGLVLNGFVALVLAGGHFFPGGVFMLIASSFDALDGTLARMTGRQSLFGAFFDSTLDRYSEAVVIGGLLYYFVEQGARTETLLAYAAIVGSLMVSYARARAEGLGVACAVGVATRFERIMIVAIGLIVGRVTLALWLVAILANLTAVHRMVHVSRVTKETAVP